MPTHSVSCAVYTRHLWPRRMLLLQSADVKLHELDDLMSRLPVSLQDTAIKRRLTMLEEILSDVDRIHLLRAYVYTIEAELDWRRRYMRNWPTCITRMWMPIMSFLRDEFRTDNIFSKMTVRYLMEAFAFSVIGPLLISNEFNVLDGPLDLVEFINSIRPALHMIRDERLVPMLYEDIGLLDYVPTVKDMTFGQLIVAYHLPVDIHQDIYQEIESEYKSQVDTVKLAITFAPVVMLRMIVQLHVTSDQEKHTTLEVVKVLGNIFSLSGCLHPYQSDKTIDMSKSNLRSILLYFTATFPASDTFLAFASYFATLLQHTERMVFLLIRWQESNMFRDGLRVHSTDLYASVASFKLTIEDLIKSYLYI